MTEDSKTLPDNLKFLSRLGWFRISRDQIRARPDALLPLFGKMVIVEAKIRWEHDSVEYLAASELFEPVPDGLRAPKYVVKRQEDASWTAERVEP